MQPPRFLQKLFKEFPDLFYRNYPLKEKNTWGVGGNAAFAYFPEKQEDVISFFREMLLHERFPHAVLGGGSNVLVSDGTFSGCMIFMERLNKLFLLSETSSDMIMVYADSGVPLGKLLRFCLENSLGGLEFGVGIPGSVGGALVGNAGSQGRAVGNLVRYVDVLLPDASVERIPGSAIHWGYRYSSLSQKPWIILGCALGLRREPPDILEKKIAFFGEKRKGQPVFRKTAGSVFKNPPGEYAGKLLELSGCKGREIGGARVSLEHANFIENHNGASSQDILDLIFLCRKMVMERTGIVLYPEVRFVGFKSSEIVFN